MNRTTLLSKCIRSFWARSVMVATIFAFLAGCSGQAQKKVYLEPPGPNAYLALGDSYTLGQSVKPDDCWPAQLAKALRKKDITIDDPTILARTGWTADDLLKGLERAQHIGPFSLVTLQIGANDLWMRCTPEKFRPKFASLLTKAVELAGGDSGRVLVISIPDYDFIYRKFGPPNITEALEPLNAVCQEEAARQGVGFIDVTMPCREAKEREELQSRDRFHFTPPMYAMWVEAILPETLKRLKQ